MPTIRQTNFLGGELGPLLHGRTDLPVFSKGLRTMRNFFASRHGAAVSRPGTEFVRFAGGVSMNIRLVPFVYADDQSFCLEVGHGYIRFHTNGATLLNGATPINSTTAGATEPYTLLSPYQYYDLAKLQWVQSGDVLTFVHPSYPPLELRRTSNTNWGATSYAGTVLREVSFARAAPYFRQPNGYPVLKSTHPDGTALSFSDATHPLKPWIWKETLTVQETATGLTFETAPWTIAESWTGVAAVLPVALASNQVALFSDKAVTILRGTHLELSAANVVDNTYREISRNIYRGLGELFGLVGSALPTEDFVDTGAEPDYSVQPPRSTNPFAVTDAFGAAQATLKPSAVAYFQDRLVFAVGSHLFFSATGNYTDYDSHIIQVAGEALHYQLAARRREETVGLVALDRLLIHTKSSAWSMAGAEGAAIDFDSIDTRLEDEVGSIGLPPLVVNGVVYFARAKGVGVRGLYPDQRGYVGRDVSVVSQHLFQGVTTDTLPSWLMAQVAGQPVLTQRSLIDWTYAEDPWGLVWAVREDGTLLSFTPHAEGGAWARHDTQGYVRAVCAVPEGGEDGVYVAVVRAISGSAGVMCIERMTSRMVKGDPWDGGCLDCSLIFNDAPSLTIGGLTHLAGSTVYAVAKGNPPWGPLVVSAAGVLTLPELPVGNSDADGNYVVGGAKVVVYVGLNFTADLETLDLAQSEVRTKQKVTDHVGFELDESRGVKCGQDFDNLAPLLKRAPAASYAAPVPETGLFRIPVKGAWGLTGRCALRQELPLFVTVVGLVREVSLGD